MTESLQFILNARFGAAIAAVAPGVELSETPVRPSKDPKFGDYQCNAALPLAKPLAAKPREIAERIVAAVDLSDIADPLEIAGAGFINIRLKTDFIAGVLASIEPEQPDAAAQSKIQNPKSKIAEDRFGIPPVPAAERKRVVVDYSSPNVAKQMHVGHIRSTIIGDVFARVLAFQGHEVIRQNHVGDWGTAIGMVILGLWYTETRQARGETEETIAQRVQSLLAAREKPPAERRALVEPICAEWTHDVKKPLAAPRVPTLDELELGYKFVQALIAAANDLGCQVEDEAGNRTDITAIPRKVTQFLQEGGEKHRWERETWQRARDISVNYCQGLYDRLGVLLTPADICGESFYNDRLAPAITALSAIFAPNADAAPSTNTVSGATSITRPEGSDSAGRDAGGSTAAHTASSADQSKIQNPKSKIDAPLVRESLLAPDSAGIPSRPAGRAEMRTDNGALCIFLYDEKGEPRFKRQDGDALPIIVRKSDGAYLYASTDLAAVRYRIHELPFPDTGQVGANRIIYVTGAPQRLHYEMFFIAARLAGWAGPDVSLEHVAFGIILGEDRKPFRTREGGTVRLADVLDEAVQRARSLVDENDAKRQSDLGQAAITDAEKQQIAERVGIAAVKYADLSKDRNTDYIFSYDKMMAMQGNTAPYMMYAYARIRSIYRKATEHLASGSASSEPRPEGRVRVSSADGPPLVRESLLAPVSRMAASSSGAAIPSRSADPYAADVKLVLHEPAERALALRIATLGDVIDAVAADLLPHVLCGYLYDLASEFMRFYESCPVITAPDEATRLSRMRLCDLTARALRLGLSLLGIPVIERM